MSDLMRKPGATEPSPYLWYTGFVYRSAASCDHAIKPEWRREKSRASEAMPMALCDS